MILATASSGPTASPNPVWARRLAAALLLLLCITENARQVKFSSLAFSVAMDTCCALLLLANIRRLSWVFWTSVGIAGLLGVVHWASFEIPVPVVLNCAKTLPLLVGTAEIVTSTETSSIDANWERRAHVLLSIATVAFAGYAVYQSLTEFRHHEEYYNGVFVAGNEGMRLPSIFYNYGTYAKFNLAAGIFLYRALIRNLRPRWLMVAGIGGVLVGLVMSGQRVALVALIAVVMVVSLTSRRILVLGAGAALLGLAVVGARLLGLTAYADRALAAFTLERVTTQFLGSLIDWFASTPWYGWGFGAGGGGGFVRLVEASSVYTSSLATVINYAYRPDTTLEGAVPFLVLSGGPIWLLAHLLGAVATAVRGTTTTRQILGAVALWGITHVVIDSASSYVFSIVLSTMLLGNSAPRIPLIPPPSARKSLPTQPRVTAPPETAW